MKNNNNYKQTNKKCISFKFYLYISRLHFHVTPTLPGGLQILLVWGSYTVAFCFS